MTIVNDFSWQEETRISGNPKCICICIYRHTRCLFSASCWVFLFSFILEAVFSLPFRPLSSSVLYVTGLVTGFAGWLSPVCLLMVAGILYLYRHAKAQVALSLNLRFVVVIPVSLFSSSFANQATEVATIDAPSLI